MAQKKRREKEGGNIAFLACHMGKEEGAAWPKQLLGGRKDYPQWQKRGKKKQRGKNSTEAKGEKGGMERAPISFLSFIGSLLLLRPKVLVIWSLRRGKRTRGRIRKYHDQLHLVRLCLESPSPENLGLDSRIFLSLSLSNSVPLETLSLSSGPNILSPPPPPPFGKRVGHIRFACWIAPPPMVNLFSSLPPLSHTANPP